MEILKRLFGICRTQHPADAGCFTVNDNTIEVDLGRAPELAEPGGAIRLEGSDLGGGDLAERVLVVHTADGYRAYRNRCAHVGRRLDPIDGGARLQCCSVGKSTYDLDGAIESGWAKGELVSYAVEAADDKLVITIG